MKRVFLCAFQSPHTHPVPSYSFWRPYFKSGFEEAGWEVVEPVNLDLAEPLLYMEQPGGIKKWQEQTWPELLLQLKTQHKKRPVDLFFAYFYGVHARKEHIEAIRDMGVPMAHFFCDNLRDFHAVQSIVGCFDLHWVPEKLALEKYTERGANAIYMPMAINSLPAVNSTVLEKPEIAFVGSADWCRVSMFSELNDSGLPLAIYGNGWVDNPAEKNSDILALNRRWLVSVKQHLKRIYQQGLTGECRYFKTRNWRNGLAEKLSNISRYPAPPDIDYLNILRNSMVCLGINRYPNFSFPVHHQPAYSRLRDVEAPMAGACYLTESTPEISDMYDIGKEIEVYSGVDELITKAERLLADNQLRKTLRQCGQKAAKSKHTLTRRIETIEKTMGL